MKCAQCNQDVHIRLIGQHDCTAQPPIPSLPPALMARGLSSFFRPPQPIGDAYKPSQRLLATEEEADEFDFDEMLHSASGFEIPSCENGRPAVGRGPSRIPLLPMFSGSNSSASVDSLTPGCFSPLEVSRVPGDNIYIPAAAPAPVLAPPRAEPQSALTRLDHARDELIMHTQPSRGVADSFLSPDSASSFESSASPMRPQTSGNARAYTSQQAPQLSTSLRPSVNNSNNGVGGGNNGHKKTGSIAITAFPPVSPPDSGPKTTAGRRNKEGGSEAPAIVQPFADHHQSLGIGGSRGVGDTQIRLSSRKALPASLSPESSISSSSPSSLSKSGGGLALLSSTMMPERQITRNATAPPSMAGSLGGNVSRQQSPLDVLASLVSNNPSGHQPVAAPPLPGPSLPRIDTQVGARAIAIGRKTPVGSNASLAGMAGSKAAGAGKSLKSAKLDSLLDDLMGEMQALSAEVRTESDRESMVSTASNSASNSAASPSDNYHHGNARARFDSTVSSASSSSTLSSHGVGRRGAACATCGVSIAGLKGSVVRSSSAAVHNGEVAPGTAAVEHQGRVYCVRDYKKAYATGCRACDKACDTTNKSSVFALDAWWHRTCFNCQECREPFPDKSFYVLDQRPYCRYDYHKLNRSLCMACAEPIEGPCAQVMEGRFHPKCFACAHCGESLKDVYYSLNGRFLCEAHVHQQPAYRSADRRKTVYGHV
ncbi:hypothetical protein IW152_001835 [Coemansia sp. BCRC 34962]|nr:hypothetical protein IW152_001835 [Coemansia sp. BCRC 34962]